MTIRSVCSIVLVLACFQGVEAGDKKMPKIRHKVSVEKAYKMIPHRRTKFTFKGSTVKGDDKAYLEKAFKIVDEAVRCRVVTMHDYAKKAPKKAGKLRNDYQKLLDYLKTLTPPKKLAKYQESLISAMTAQIDFFKEWEKGGKSFRYGGLRQLRSHPKVTGASRFLIAGYQVLMRAYAGESKKNKEAFFDYHCSLDFI
ncbi:MAG: hypothetical protein P1V97_01645 [Planctomycetota bacterium]|nr:hypothetical protein [Planctomycetota bacterium]